MICETCPSSGGTIDPLNWTNFFEVLFNKISANPHMKAIVYLSEPWSKGVIQHWEDTRMTTNSSITNQTLLQNYIDEIDNSKYIHLAEYLQNPDLIDTSLPIFLSAFKVHTEIDHNLIEWETSSELNNLGFNIYKSSSINAEMPDEQTFTRVNNQLIRGAGNTSESQFYFYQDIDIEEEHYYWYQLEDVDYDGVKTKHTIVKVHRSGIYSEAFALYQNYPNPFNPLTKIRFDLPQQETVSIKLYDISGKLVKILLNNRLSGGSHEIEMAAGNLASGIYLYRIEAGKFQDVKKMKLLR